METFHLGGRHAQKETAPKHPVCRYRGLRCVRVARADGRRCGSFVDGCGFVSKLVTRQRHPNIMDRAISFFKGGNAPTAPKPKPRKVAKIGAGKVKLRARKSVVASSATRSG